MAAGGREAGGPGGRLGASEQPPSSSICSCGQLRPSAASPEALILAQLCRLRICATIGNVLRDWNGHIKVDSKHHCTIKCICLASHI